MFTRYKSLFVGMMIAVGCGSEQGQTYQNHLDEAKDLVKQANTEAKALSQQAQAMQASTEKWLADVNQSGELSETAKIWLQAKATLADAGIESLLVHGKLILPTAIEIGKVLNNAVDQDTVVEPIFAKLADDSDTSRSAQEKADQAIKQMTKVEVIDGLTVGFMDLTSSAEGMHRTETGYLVVWRQENYLVGFIYRSRKQINVEMLMHEAPRLIQLVRKAI